MSCIVWLVTSAISLQALQPHPTSRPLHHLFSDASKHTWPTHSPITSAVINSSALGLMVAEVIGL